MLFQISCIFPPLPGLRLLGNSARKRKVVGGDKRGWRRGRVEGWKENCEIFRRRCMMLNYPCMGPACSCMLALFLELSLVVADDLEGGMAGCGCRGSAFGWLVFA